jgi:adenylate kinase family enzyme
MSNPNLYSSHISKRVIQRSRSTDELKTKQNNFSNQEETSKSDLQLPQDFSWFRRTTPISALTEEPIITKNDNNENLARLRRVPLSPQTQSKNLNTVVSASESVDIVNKLKNPNTAFKELLAYTQVYTKIKEMNFKRILILGSPGSGKSTFATKIADKIDLPLFRMDDLFWNPSWVPTEFDSFNELSSKIVENENWVIEGNYAQFLDIRLTRAQFVIYIDTPTSICLWRALNRSLYRFLGYNDGLPEKIKNTNSHIFSFKNKYELFKNIITFSKKVRPVIIEKIQNKAIPFTVISMEGKCHQLFLNFIGLILKPFLFIKEYF